MVRVTEIEERRSGPFEVLGDRYMDLVTGSVDLSILLYQALP